ncbi:hypothetical protein BASA83_013122 [Batrachochytrium salamandrivorans]|nr:hypothetical protein BASA83_013122 [Batrachochytrium salamandrivorans]
MEKLVADLSARIKSLEKESIILQKEARSHRSYSQPCHTGMCHFLPIQLQLRENQKSFFLTNSTDLAVTIPRFPQPTQTNFRISTTQPTAPSS